jgi:AcrR family transcriptional regulator
VLLRPIARSFYKAGVPRRTDTHTAQTREAILARAVDIASTEGLEGLTIGRLAEAHSMSKSGVFAHFGSKEELQLAVVESARQIFVREVFRPHVPSDPGLPRLQGLARAWLAYIERGLFRGGCFFAAVSAEVDDRPGRVRDRVVELTRGWILLLEHEAEGAISAGHLEAGADPNQIAFEIHAFVQEANWAFQLHGDADAFARARSAIERCLRADASVAGRTLLEND